jgi:16S rRNA (guanine966-N2)-methyltransferase
MRVVAGTARGRRITAPEGNDVRPTSDRVREALFNALGSLGAVEGATVLDLFAGSGALGIEALSRGADRAVFVDADRSARRAVAANLDVTGFSDRAEVVASDAFRYAGSAGTTFDLVLLDPPYRTTDWEVLLPAVEPILSAETVVVVESDHEVALPPTWRVERRRRYGSTFVAIARPPATHRPSQPEQR